MCGSIYIGEDGVYDGSQAKFVGQANKAVNPNERICALPGCTKPCAVRGNTGGYHKHCCQEHLHKDYGIKFGIQYAEKLTPV